MLISIFWHFHPPYVFSTFFFSPSRVKRGAAPQRCRCGKETFSGMVIEWKPENLPQVRGQTRFTNFHTARTSADNTEAAIAIFTPRGQARTRSVPFRVTKCESRGHPRTRGNSSKNPADIRGHPRTFRGQPRMPCFHSPRTMLHPQTREVQQICSPPKPNLLHDGGPHQILSGQPRYISNSSPKS